MGDLMKDDNEIKQLVIELTELRSQNAELKKSITSSISAELAAEEVSRYAESIVETVREPLLVLDVDLKIISANRNFYRTFKATPGETIGSFIYDLGNKQWDIPKLRELLEEVLPKQETFDDFEVDHNFQDIGHKIMLLNARRISQKYTGAKMILLAIEDITEPKRLENLLTESEERYRRLFETASDAIVLLEKREGEITHANPATEKMLGYTKEECIGNKLPGIGVILDMGDFQTTIQNLNKCGILNYDDVQVKTKSGQHLDTDIYLVDRARLAQCNIRDITERKQTANEIMKLNEELKEHVIQLQTINNELEAFIYSIAHDLRQPLRTMSVFAKALVERHADSLDRQANDYLARIGRSATKMNQLIADLLSLSRISRQEIVRTSVDLSTLALVNIAELREASPDRSVAVAIAEGLFAIADQHLMDLVLSNLIGNAWKFTSKTENARIEFGATEDDGKTVYYVRDNGVGFDPEYADKMFRPFHRLHSNAEFEGTGIGLTIVERIVHYHGGKLWAEGEVDKGATFYFTLTRR